MSTTSHTIQQKKLRRKEAAVYLGVSVRTLDRWALLGRGPRFTLVTPRLALYDIAELEAYLASCPTGGEMRPAA
jgi:hypothetical protein